MKIYTLFFCALAILIVGSTDAYACACCAEKGFYSISYTAPDAYAIEEIQKIKFDATANLYMDAGGEDSIKGISSIAESYNFTGSFLNKKWNLTFKDANKSGVLSLPIPAKMVKYAVDMHENENAEPLLYKEWRFEGAASGTGIFQGGIAPPTKYFLVLQGRGNGCDNASDFTHWRLEVTGKKASYAFYGKLKVSDNQ